MLIARQIVVVVAGAHQEGIVRQVSGLAELLEPGTDLLHAGAAAEIHLIQHGSHTGEMAVRVDKGGQHGLALQVDDLRLRGFPVEDLVVAAHFPDASVLHQNGFHNLFAIHGDDFSVIINCLIHSNTSFSVKSHLYSV